MIQDLDVFLAYPWGRECYSLTIKSIKSKDVSCLSQSSMAIQGFIHGLQLVALSCIPEVISFATTTRSNKKASISLESDSENENEKDRTISMRQIKKLDTEMEVNVAYTLRAQGLEEAHLSWPDEKEDDTVSHVMDLLEKDHLFSADSWTGGVDAVPLCEQSKAQGTRGKNPKKDKRKESLSMDEFLSLKNGISTCLTS